MPENRSFDMKIYVKKPSKITANNKMVPASEWMYDDDNDFVSVKVNEDLKKEKDVFVRILP
jgi:hypothetical protein